MVECKASRADFYADRKKYQAYTHDDDSLTAWGGIRHSIVRMDKEYAARHGYRLIDLSRMGNFRFFMTNPDVVTDEMVAANAPDHGLLWVEGGRVRVVRAAQRRKPETIDKDCEIRYLRFAIINAKKPFVFQDAPELALPCTR